MEITQIYTVTSSESFLQTSGQNSQLGGLDTQILEARASVNSFGTQLYFQVIKKIKKRKREKRASYEGLPSA